MRPSSSSDSLQALVQTLGESLQERRLSKKLSLEDVSQKTRIRSSILRALEEGPLEDIPKGIYMVGFFKTYADFLQMDGEAFIQTLRQESMKAARGEATPIQHRARRNGLDTRRGLGEPGPLSGNRVLLYGVIFSVLLVAGLLFVLLPGDQTDLGVGVPPDVSSLSDGAPEAPGAVSELFSDASSSSPGTLDGALDGAVDGAVDGVGGNETTAADPTNGLSVPESPESPESPGSPALSDLDVPTPQEVTQEAASEAGEGASLAPAASDPVAASSPSPVQSGDPGDDLSDQAVAVEAEQPPPQREAGISIPTTESPASVSSVSSASPALPEPPSGGPAPAAVARVPQIFGFLGASEVDVIALESSLVQIREPSGQIVFSDTLHPGDVYKVNPNLRLLLTTPNAGGLEIRVGGEAIEPIGRVGAPRRNYLLQGQALRQGTARQQGQALRTQALRNTR